MQRQDDGSDVTGFGSFDNSTCKRVLDLLEPGDLRLGQVVIKRVAVVKLGQRRQNPDLIPRTTDVQSSNLHLRLWALIRSTVHNAT